ncbi:hypothetical protein EYF80_010231 [Liparis tanakae]|uniref:Uncharacterized protein n=1 Tax=Liparis tanakae TaxID=230148 RepID=A0A4Z2INN7_9TELE|nr:hypothetical protein EYF80_010231 [Liparis tanakae]
MEVSGRSLPPDENIGHERSGEALGCQANPVHNRDNSEHYARPYRHPFCKAHFHREIITRCPKGGDAK